MRLRTVLAPELFPASNLDILRGWSAIFWDPNLQATSIPEDYVFPDIVHVASDGSASPNSGGFAWYEVGSRHWFAAGSQNTHYPWMCSSAQYAEAHSILHILQNIPAHNINMYLDCRNVVDAFNRILQGESVKTSSSRIEWLQELYAAKTLASGRNINVVWVKSHSHHLANRIADNLANKARKHAKDGEKVSVSNINMYIEKLRQNASYHSPEQHIYCTT
jgi:ribonuclease HI